MAEYTKVHELPGLQDLAVVTAERAVGLEVIFTGAQWGLTGA